MAVEDIFRVVKNSAITVLAQNYINNKIKEYGKIVSFNIDSKNKNIELEILLKGEKENTFIKIEKYEVVRKNDLNIIKFKNISTSREWITVLIHNMVIPSYALNNMIEIDPTYAKIISLLI